MNRERFDDLTRALATGRVSRGRMLKMVAAAAFGGALGGWASLWGSEGAAAKGKCKRKKWPECDLPDGTCIPSDDGVFPCLSICCDNCGIDPDIDPDHCGGCHRPCYKPCFPPQCPLLPNLPIGSLNCKYCDKGQCIDTCRELSEQTG